MTNAFIKVNYSILDLGLSTDKTIVLSYIHGFGEKGTRISPKKHCPLFNIQPEDLLDILETLIKICYIKKTEEGFYVSSI